MRVHSYYLLLILLYISFCFTFLSFHRGEQDVISSWFSAFSCRLFVISSTSVVTGNQAFNESSSVKRNELLQQGNENASVPISVPIPQLQGSFDPISANSFKLIPLLSTLQQVKSVKSVTAQESSVNLHTGSTILSSITPMSRYQSPSVLTTNSSSSEVNAMTIIPRNISFQKYLPEDVCNNYTTYLKYITYDYSKPFLVSVTANLYPKRLVVYFVFATKHLEKNGKWRHCEYILKYGNEEYENTLRTNGFDGFSEGKFVIPSPSVLPESPLMVTLIDKTLNYVYQDIILCPRYPVKKRTVGICALVTTYNSIEELRTWMAYYQLQRVDAFIFYVFTPYPELYRAFPAMIASKSLILVDFTWPRLRHDIPAILNIQNAQMNSCYCEFNFFFKYLFFCDTDEYAFSERFPSNIPSGILAARNIFPRYTTFYVTFL